MEYRGVRFEDLPRHTQLVSYLWVSWALASGHGAKDKTASAVTGLCTMLPFRDAEPEDDASRSDARREVRHDVSLSSVVGYSVRNDALWLRPNRDEVALAIGSTLENTHNLFYADRTLYLTLHGSAYKEALARWRRAGKLYVGKSLRREAARKTYLEIVRIGMPELSYRDVPTCIPFLGPLIIGYEEDGAEQPGVVWIGIRHDEQLLDRAPGDQACRLRHPTGVIRPYTAPCSGGAALDWWPYTDRDFVNAIRAAPQAYASACRDILTSVNRDVSGATAVGSGVHASSLLGAHAWFRAPLAAEVIAGSGPRRVIVATDSCYNDAEDVMYRALPLHYQGGLCVEILAREHAVTFLSLFPWFWSRHFGEHRGVQVIADADRLYSVLGVARSGVVHDAVADRSLARGERLLLLGRLGQGKTMALGALGETFLRYGGRQRLLVVLREHCTDEDVTIARNLLMAFHDAADCLVMIDDLDRALVNPLMHDRLHRLWHDSALGGVGFLAAATSEQDVERVARGTPHVAMDQPSRNCLAAIAGQQLGTPALAWAQKPLHLWATRLEHGDATLREFRAFLDSLAVERAAAEERFAEFVRTLRCAQDKALDVITASLNASDIVAVRADREEYEALVRESQRPLRGPTEEERRSTLHAAITKSSPLERLVWSVLLSCRYAYYREARVVDVRGVMEHVLRRTPRSVMEVERAVGRVLGFFDVIAGVVSLDEDVLPSLSGELLWTSEEGIATGFFDVLQLCAAPTDGVDREFLQSCLFGFGARMMDEHLFGGAAMLFGAHLVEYPLPALRKILVASLWSAHVQGEGLDAYVRSLREVLQHRVDDVGLLADALELFAPQIGYESLCRGPGVIDGNGMRRDVARMINNNLVRPFEDDMSITEFWRPFVVGLFGPVGIARGELAERVRDELRSRGGHAMRLAGDIECLLP